jgi:hypothetical protein
MEFSKIPRRLSPGAAVLPGLLAATALAGACGQHSSQSRAFDQVDASMAANGDSGVPVPPSDASPGPDGSSSGSSSDSSAAAKPEAAAPVPEAAPPPDTGELVGTTTGPQTCGFNACAPGAPCADLTVDQSDLAASLRIGFQDFAATDCAVAEGCILQTGTRRLLRFDTATQNVGNADVQVGDPTQNACFQWSDCHQHYHFRGVGKYTLYQSDGTTVAAVGHKQGFCLEDVEPIPSASPPAPDPANPYTCSNQGLHVGWEDVYPNDIDCQWIDVTGLPTGTYVLSVVINGDEYLPESNYANNEARVSVMIP